MKVIVYKFFHYNLFKGVILFDVPKVIYSKNVQLGEGSRINSNVFIHGQGHVEIGRNVTISHGATILSTGYCLDDWANNQKNKMHVHGKVTIADNVWIGANVTIVSGVNISKGVVVGAGSIVTKDLICSNALYAGVPARMIKQL
ncbi:acyltransferase [Thaumasiovibrio sp. DFM-14]|uniref:acyltransferase n=1 Tax=Thaumasiovibrio sp. DFM-14 TaxID=3384792 RepID=UPI0039A1B025